MSILYVDQPGPGVAAPTQLSTQDRYVLETTIGIEFWANGAELERAHEIARATVISRIYANIGALMPELRFAVYNGDRETAMTLIGQIEDITRGKV